jgi:hypothetical protein
MSLWHHVLGAATWLQIYLFFPQIMVLQFSNYLMRQFVRIGSVVGVVWSPHSLKVIHLLNKFQRSTGLCRWDKLTLEWIEEDAIHTTWNQFTLRPPLMKSPVSKCHPAVRRNKNALHSVIADLCKSAFLKGFFLKY